MTTATTDAGAVGPGRGGRMSRPRKREAVLRLLRGEDLETVSRTLGVTAATLSGWRDAFLAAGEVALATRPGSGEELESERLKGRPATAGAGRADAGCRPAGRDPGGAGREPVPW